MMVREREESGIAMRPRSRGTRDVSATRRDVFGEEREEAEEGEERERTAIVRHGGQVLFVFRAFSAVYLFVFACFIYGFTAV